MNFNFNPFHTPSATEIAQRELEEAKRILLAQQAAAEHATKMVEYYQGVVCRLTQYVQQETSAPPVQGLT